MRPPTATPLQILHSHSTFSVLDGASTVEAYVLHAKEHGLTHCGLTDHGYALGLHDLAKQCAKHDITPINGVEFYTMPRAGYNFIGKPYDYGHITLWAANAVGYKNLITLASRSWMPDRVIHKWGKPKPRITFEDMAAFSDGIICGSGCIEGPIAKPLLRGEMDEAILNANLLKDIYGDRLYFEVMPHAVDRNYSAEAVIKVKGMNGVEYAFAATDMVETPNGQMTAEEAMKARVTEIWSPSPVRVQDGLILAPGEVECGREVGGRVAEFTHEPDMGPVRNIETSE